MTGAVDPRVFALSGFYAIDFWADKYLVAQVFFLLLICLVSLFFLGRALYRLFFFRKKNIQEEATERLNILKNQAISCQTKEEYKRLYYDLTHLIKWYVERSFFISVLSLTDDEAILCINNRLKDDEVMQNIRSIFQNALGIKYAQHHTLQEQVQQDIQKTTASVKKITLMLNEKK
jgi:septum formation topological specificity factor MinE